MPQKYKAVYFFDFPADSAKQKSLTLGFGSKSIDLYETVRDLTSEEIRQLLGSSSFEDLAASATADELPLNTYCIRQLRRSVGEISTKWRQQLAFSGMFDKGIFDPVSVTFKGGSKEPFIRWYPYLEGYSPDYVKAILEKYAPDARCVLDPFSGNGTTALTAAGLGVPSYFCEVNPVLQFASQTKICVRRMVRDIRVGLSAALRQAAQGLGMIANFPPDLRLNGAYSDCFGDSVFFDQATYDQVLRARSWIDEAALVNPILADLMTIAVLAALVPASRMQRAGDLRYKTISELDNNAVSLISGIRENLARIASDLQSDVDGLAIEPILISENARSLASIPCLNVDTIITSPPYVNGTNYFRNTKIELWFMRCLTQKSDLAKFRSEALTAGINDVTIARIANVMHPEVKKVVSELERNTYDRRIPQMVGIYFTELTDIFRGLCRHLVPNATVAIDIGDSCYAGVHVPVDRLISACLEELGFAEKDQIQLRKRRSKGGAILKQTLLVYNYRPNGTKLSPVSSSVPWSKEWERYKARIPHQSLPYSKRNWGHALHSLCSYPGKLKPAIAHHLVKIFTPERGRIMDPFAGVGTIPFEGALQGRMTFGLEISPAAFAIAKAKIQLHSLNRCKGVIKQLEAFLQDSKPTESELNDTRVFGYNGKLTEYYHIDTLKEIILARRFFLSHPPSLPEEFFVLASLLHILHGNRPYALSRRSHPLTPYRPSGPAEYRSLLRHLETKVARSLREDLPPDFQPGIMFFQDATAWWPREIDQLDAVITSPPFFDSTRFYLANWLRLWFCGWDTHDFEGRPSGFVDERQKMSFDVYVPILRQARERLRPGGVVVMHLGKSAKCDMTLELQRLGKRWFHSVDILSESVLHCESHGIRDKGNVTSHEYMVLY
ncbi:MAG: hypothetical protein IBX68_02685 [Dehalococcoidia bacterium]|nr:hypothetical protein [Dehalococcoidia bacterium]